MAQFRPQSLVWLLLTLVVFVLDQATKQWVLENMALFERVEVLFFFNMTHVHNYGAAFSFLSDQSGWQRWFLLAVTSIISLVILIWLSRLNSNQKLLAAALALVLGGALGNLFDRAVYGYVVDFIDWHYGGYHFPAFNLADSAISLGAVLLILDTLINTEPGNSEQTDNT